MKAKDIIVSDDRFRKEIGDITELKQSIMDHGQMQPIVVDSKNNLIAGLRRLIVCKELSIDPKVTVIDFDNPIQAQIDENMVRKDLLPSEIYAIGQYVHETESKKPGPKSDSSCINDTGISPIDKTVTLTGAGRSTISKINKIFQSDDEELKNAVDSGKRTINSAYHILKSCEKHSKILGRPVSNNASEDVNPIAYGDNIYYLPQKPRRHWSTKYIKEGDPFPTLTTSSLFFHITETGDVVKEFSLREYARVQGIPDYFKLFGSVSSIHTQIGNAVSPPLADHIISKYISKDLKVKTCGDLFAGCGGLSLGAEMNGIRSIWAVEWDLHAAITYKLNFPEAKMHRENIKELNPSEFERVDLITGGPPCQGFSRAGYQYKDDPKNELYKEFHRFVEALKPGVFIMENVPEIAKIKDEIIKDFEEIGYEVRTELVKGEDIGMRQKRHRFFFIGTLRPEAMIQELPKAA